MSEKRDWYISGPMSGYPQFNIPAFDAVEWALQHRGGYSSWNPSRLDKLSVRQQCLLSAEGNPGEIHGITWGECIARDVLYVAERSYGIVLLDGWHLSRGARIEALVAHEVGLRFAFWDRGRLCDAENAQSVAMAELSRALKPANIAPF